MARRGAGRARAGEDSPGELLYGQLPWQTAMFRDIDHILAASHDRPHTFHLVHALTPPTPG